jgi:hypothetical protein
MTSTGEIEYAPGKATTFKFIPLTPGNAINVAGERFSNQVYLSEAGISPLMSDVLVDESIQLAKQSIRLQSSEALMTQAFSLNENILNTLLQPAL